MVNVMMPRGFSSQNIRMAVVTSRIDAAGSLPESLKVYLHGNARFENGALARA